MINIRDFDTSLLKIKKNRTRILVSITLDALPLKKKDDYENIHSVNPLYLTTDEVNGFIKVEKMEINP